MLGLRWDCLCLGWVGCFIWVWGLFLIDSFVYLLFVAFGVCLWIRLLYLVSFVLCCMIVVLHTLLFSFVF